jgi:hypothetical protein
MSKASILRNGRALASMTPVPLAFCPTFAEARGVGVTHWMIFGCNSRRNRPQG